LIVDQTIIREGESEMSLNRIVLIGHLVKDPEMKYTPQGVAVATMRIAVNRFTKNEQGQYDSDFFDLVAWRRSAEFASNYLKKGQKVSVDGRLQTRSWVDQTSGQKRTAYEIVVENIDGLDKRSDSEHSSSAEMGGQMHDDRQYSAPRTTARPTAPSPPQDDIEESDPFADE
jgi:single-strand DNA-binding protein